jgi:hypothetical protein
MTLGIEIVIYVILEKMAFKTDLDMWNYYKNFVYKYADVGWM